MKFVCDYKIFSLAILIGFIGVVYNLTSIPLKVSLANYHTEYLLNLKFQQISMYSKSIKSDADKYNESQLYLQKFSSFMTLKDIPLHQQVLAQKRLATYYGVVNVGFGRHGVPNKTQSFKMLFDTGSCEFWIPSSVCVTSRCISHSRYTQSHTFNPYLNSKMAIQYLSGKVEGLMATETIGIGDLIVPNQVIGVATEVNIPLLDEVIWDGILGLAYPNKNLKKQGIKPLFDNIINQNILKNKGDGNQFAYYLGHDNGSISFGGAEMKYKLNINEEFKWSPITERSYWTITLLDIRKYPKNIDKNVRYLIILE